MARVVWSVVARDDLKALVDYIKAVSLFMQEPSVGTFNNGWGNYSISLSPVERCRKIRAEPTES
jgi:hypothetical protein